jgi:hypothetical protein
MKERDTVVLGGLRRLCQRTCLTVIKSPHKSCIGKEKEWRKDYFLGSGRRGGDKRRRYTYAKFDQWGGEGWLDGWIGVMRKRCEVVGDAAVGVSEKKGK